MQHSPMGVGVSGRSSCCLFWVPIPNGPASFVRGALSAPCAVSAAHGHGRGR